MSSFHARVFESFSRFMERHGLRWVVLHGEEELPAAWANDLDLCVERRTFALAAEWVDELWRDGVAEPALAFASTQEELGVVLEEPLRAGDGGRARGRAHLDLSSDVVVAQIVRAIRCEEVLGTSEQRPSGFFVPSRGVRFAFLLTKRAEKGPRAFEERQAAELFEAFSRAGDVEARLWVERLFGPPVADRILAALSSRDAAQVRAGLASWLRALTRHAVRNEPRDAARLAAGLCRRIAGRISEPSGISVALLGPDGSGKSSVARALTERLGRTFWSAEVQHLRPGIAPDLAVLVRPWTWPRHLLHPEPRVVTEPHAGTPSGPAGSLARLSYYGADWLLGYFPRVRLKEARNAAVVLDRWHHDLAVDPRRFKMTLAPRAARTASAFLPRADLLLVLDAPAELMRARKAEVDAGELARQRAEYLRLGLSLPAARVIDASRPLSAVIEDADAAVRREQARRVMRRLHAEAAERERSRLPVLVYHGVGLAEAASRVAERGGASRPAALARGGKIRWAIPRERLARDLRDLTETGFRIVSLGGRDPRGGRQVALTFDDGLITDLEIVLPLLVEAGARATFFPISGKIGRPGYLDRGGLRALKAAGMEIGSHARSHRLLTGLSRSEQRDELRASKAEIEDAIGARVEWLAFPGGALEPGLLEIAREAGYAGACTIEWRLADPALADFLVPRCTIGNGFYGIRAIDVALDRPASRARRAVLGVREVARGRR